MAYALFIRPPMDRTQVVTFSDLVSSAVMSFSSLRQSVNKSELSTIMKFHSSKSSSRRSSSSKETLDNDATSTHSTVSAATTLQGDEVRSFKKKWISSHISSKQNKDKVYSKNATHNEAAANYFSLR